MIALVRRCERFLHSTMEKSPKQDGFLFLNISKSVKPILITGATAFLMNAKSSLKNG